MSEKSFTLEEWANSKVEHFDHKAEYEERIEPLVNEVHRLCKEIGVVLVVKAFYAQNDDGASSHVVQSLPAEPGKIPPAALTAALVDHPNMDGMSKLSAVVGATGRRMRAHFAAVAETESATKH